jgi:hypothetical protein
MDHFSSDDVKAYLEKIIKDSANSNKGVYLVHDSLTVNKLPLVYEKIDLMRTLHGYGCFPEVIFAHQDDKNKKYLVDFWVKSKDGKLSLFDVRIYKAPKEDGGKWGLVKHLPKPWWWIPASKHPGESEQRRS